MSTSPAMIAAARALLGVPFAHQGRSSKGLDCLGLLLLSAQHAGLQFDGVAPLALDTPHYGTRPDEVKLQTRLLDYLQPVNRAQPGDVLLLEIEGRAQHLALVSDYPYPEMLAMIHAYAITRKVVEHQYDAAWQARTRMILRLAAH